MPQISSLVLGKMLKLFSNLFQETRSLSSKEELKPRQRRNHLKSQTIGTRTRQSARRKVAASVKQGVEKGNNTDSDSN
jgi:hypothetical protein